MLPKNPIDFRQAVAASGLDIYAELLKNHPHLHIPTSDLEMMLNQGMKGLDVKDLAIRTRSKFVKQQACLALGYPVPKSFTKTQPRFLGQNFDTYAQKANNLQVWNEVPTPDRRYAVVGIGEDNKVYRVKVITGTELLLLDKTGTITRKYQAQVNADVAGASLISKIDTPELAQLTTPGARSPTGASPSAEPIPNALLPIAEIFSLLTPLIGRRLHDPGRDQERNRGAELHRLACEILGYTVYSDNGQFPDIRGQLLEVKLQTSPTIDLGMALPNSPDALRAPVFCGHTLRHMDVRYAVFCGDIVGNEVVLNRLYVVSGADFFTKFRRFEGKISNAKIQIPLPDNFFL